MLPLFLFLILQHIGASFSVKRSLCTLTLAMHALSYVGARIVMRFSSEVAYV
jgi:hypothetical protein